MKLVSSCTRVALKFGGGAARGGSLLAESGPAPARNSRFVTGSVGIPRGRRRGERGRGGRAAGQARTSPRSRSRVRWNHRASPPRGGCIGVAIHFLSFLNRPFRHEIDIQTIAAETSPYSTHGARKGGGGTPQGRWRFVSRRRTKRNENRTERGDSKGRNPPKRVGNTFHTRTA